MQNLIMEMCKIPSTYTAKFSVNIPEQIRIAIKLEFPISIQFD